MHLPMTRVIENKQAPKRFPTAMYIPSSSPAAEITERISGAPLAKANNVTPEIVSLIFNDSEMSVSTGVRYVSATLPSMKKAISTSTSYVTDAYHSRDEQYLIDACIRIQYAVLVVHEVNELVFSACLAYVLTCCACLYRCVQ